ncbi:unnamed protein product [Pleuronectes platessa]|uniref:Selenoprotein T n=1 Tax=Pleuronectes platessa TaxID=8262 RepID=A0A9N7U8T3_PLEPL|nr:unnamed protein product [Pleuronectes platessa]
MEVSFSCFSHNHLFTSCRLTPAGFHWNFFDPDPNPNHDPDPDPNHDPDPDPDPDPNPDPDRYPDPDPDPESGCPSSNAAPEAGTQSNMAEYSQGGLLAALLLFTALTARDVYLGRSSPQRGHSPADSLGLSSATEPERPAKPSVYTGPVLRFQYCKVFQDYSLTISRLYPDIRIEGENHPPTPFNRCVGHMTSYLKLISILLIVSGQNPFLLLGLQTPRAWVWSQDNKIFSCLMAFFLCNMMETHFLSTGAFEVTLNDVPIWSKLQSDQHSQPWCVQVSRLRLPFSRWRL